VPPQLRDKVLLCRPEPGKKKKKEKLLVDLGSHVKKKRKVKKTSASTLLATWRGGKRENEEGGRLAMRSPSSAKGTGKKKNRKHHDLSIEDFAREKEGEEGGCEGPPNRENEELIRRPKRKRERGKKRQKK